MRRLPPAGGAGTLAGIALAIVGAVGFAAKGVIAKFLYADGWGAETVLTIRSFLALPIMAVWALWAAGPSAVLRPPPQALLGAAVAGALSYYVGALLDFRALTMIDASVERVLLFAYPSLVVVLYAVLYREWPERRVLAALCITYVGIVMVVTGLDARVLQGNGAGAGLVLVCALGSALYYLASDRWTASIGSVAFTFYALGAATVCLGLHRLIAGGDAPAVWSRRDLWLVLALVVLATVLPMLAMAEAVRRLGAPRASVVAAVGPPTTILLGAWLLDERLRRAQWIGVALIVAGILVLELSKRPAPAAGSAAG